MGLLDIFRPNATESATTSGGTTGELEQLQHQLETVTEHLMDLQREDRGWDALSQSYGTIVDRSSLTRNADLVRAMSIMNPLMKRGKLVRQGYVFGQGVEVTASNDEDSKQDVDTVVSSYLDDESNRAAVFGSQARQGIEGDLFDDGNAFIAHFTNPLTGRVKARPLPFNEITEIITAPGDRYTPWFYKRVWTETTPTETFGTSLTRQRTAYYPDLHFQPLTKTKRIGEHEVMWDAPVYHLKVNPVGRDRLWGLGDGFAAMPWARGYKEFLEDWALLMKALSRIAYQFKDKSGKAQQTRRAVDDAANGRAGGMAYTGQGEIEAVPKTGATLDSESGRPLAALVAAALGLPVTILLADPGTTGARAVAETLDTPTRLEMEARRAVHTQFYKASVGYAVEQAVIAPRGPVRGKIDRDEDRLYVTIDGQPLVVDVDFPSLEQFDVKTMMEALNIADGMNVLPPLEKLKLVAQALKMDDLASIIDQVTDDDDNFVSPDQQIADTAGQAAADALRRGEDPSGSL